MAEVSDQEFPAKLQRLFVFNSSWGPTETTEEQKIVFYHPSDETDKHKHVGLIEALIKFMSVFSEDPANVQHNSKTKTVFREFEPGFFMVMSVAAPYRTKAGNDEQREMIHLNERLHDNVLLSTLDRTYKLFKIFTGGFMSHGCDQDAIRHKCDKFFGRFVSNLNFTSHSSSLVKDLFGAVQFLTLEPLDFLHVQSFVHKVENDFPCIDKCLFLHHGNIVWSGLQQEETQLLFFYVYNTLLPNVASKLSSNATPNSPFSGYKGKFLTGPTSSAKLTSDQVNSLRIPKVFVPQTCDGVEVFKEYHFLVYHAIQSTLCLLIPTEVDFTVDFFKRIDAHLGPKLTNISADLLDVFGKNAASMNQSNDAPPSILSPSICVNPSLMDSSRSFEEDFNLVYFNDANKAMKNTCVTSAKTDEIQHCIAELHEDTHDLLSNEDASPEVKGKMSTELSVKTANDDWVVAKKVDQRELYLAFKNKGNYSLLDINDEVDKIMSSQFKNICLPP